MNKLLLVLLIVFLTACASTPEVPQVKVITETVEVEIYQPPMPPEIQLDEVKWYVITEENLDEKIAELKQFTGTEFVLFGLTPQSYENMAYNLQEIRRFMRQQTEIIKYYREATKVKVPEGWMEENESTETLVEPEVKEEEGFFKKLIPFWN